jgi:hypothetical protein
VRSDSPANDEEVLDAAGPAREARRIVFRYWVAARIAGLADAVVRLDFRLAALWIVPPVIVNAIVVGIAGPRSAVGHVSVIVATIACAFLVRTPFSAVPGGLPGRRLGGRIVLLDRNALYFCILEHRHSVLEELLEREEARLGAPGLAQDAADFTIGECREARNRDLALLQRGGSTPSCSLGELWPKA